MMSVIKTVSVSNTYAMFKTGIDELYLPIAILSMFTYDHF